MGQLLRSNQLLKTRAGRLGRLTVRQHAGRGAECSGQKTYEIAELHGSCSWWSFSVESLMVMMLLLFWLLLALGLGWKPNLEGNALHL